MMDDRGKKGGGGIREASIVREKIGKNYRGSGL
jgi:hypothetical protein